MDYSELTKAFGAFFAIMNPFVNLPIFLALTAGFTVAQQRVLAVKITVFSAIMCAIILFAGQKIIGFFRITIDQFRIAGGIVLSYIAWSMLNGQTITSHQGTDDEKDHMADLTGLAFYPITFPMIVGPGTIATLIIYAGHATDVEDLLSIGGVVAVVLAILFVVFVFRLSLWQGSERYNARDHDSFDGHDLIGNCRRNGCCRHQSCPAWTGIRNHT